MLVEQIQLKNIYLLVDLKDLNKTNSYNNNCLQTKMFK